MTTIAQTLSLILTATKAKQNPGGNGWKGHCPAHNDRSPSLSIAQGADTRILLNCHRKCDLDSICAALGITKADLYPSKQTNQSQAKPRYNLDKVYDYKDESGTLLFQSVRKRLADPIKFPNEPKKKFSQRAPDGKGNWVWSLQGIRRVLYRLPELLAADPAATVWIPEGEKDVDRLRSLGLTATCNPMGASKWLDEFSDSLVGHDCVVLSDNDPQATNPDGTPKFHTNGQPVLPGQDHAQEVAASLYSKAKSVRVLMLPNLPEKGDVSDWLDAGGDESTLCQMANALPEWEPVATTNNGHAPNPKAQSVIQEVCMADVQVMSIDWLWENRIPRGTLTIVEGIEGEGKSTMLCAIGGAVTKGQGLSDMPLTSPGNILWLSAEDDLGRVLKPRLLSVGADVTKVFAVGEPFTFNDKGVELVRQMAERRTPVMVVIDPIFAYAHGDPSKGADARVITNQLKMISEEFNCAIILVRHVGKSKGFGDPRAAGLYSIEWRAAARSVLLCGSDPDNPQRRALTQSKNTFGPISEAIGYTIEKDPSSPTGAKFNWVGHSDLTASRILSGMATDDEKAALRTACDLLQDGLSNGERLSDDIKAEAKAAGVSERTLKRARSNLGVVWRREGFGTGAIYYWRLPDASNNGFHPDHTLPLA